MLWFAGERGSMAFALAIKSRLDFQSAGDIFLPFTLVFACLTLSGTLFLQCLVSKMGFDNVPTELQEIHLPIIQGKLKDNKDNNNINNNNTNSNPNNTSIPTVLSNNSNENNNISQTKPTSNDKIETNVQAIQLQQVSLLSNQGNSKISIVEVSCQESNVNADNLLNKEEERIKKNELTNRDLNEYNNNKGSDESVSPANNNKHRSNSSGVNNLSKNTNKNRFYNSEGPTSNNTYDYYLRSFEYDSTKPFSCFDKVKAHLAMIQDKYLLPLVKRYDNEEYNNKHFPTIKISSISSEDIENQNKIRVQSRIKGINNDGKFENEEFSNNEEKDFEKDTIRISQVVSKINDLEEISNYNYDISGYIDNEKDKD